MKLLLLKEVDGLGIEGSTVDVKPGYARNYLIPKGMAILFTPSNLKIFEERKKQEIVRANKAKKEAIRLKGELEKISLTIPVTAGEDGKLFGTVTNKDIEDLLVKEKFEIDRHKIVIPEHIKETGVYIIKVKLHPEVTANVKLWVVSKD